MRVKRNFDLVYQTQNDPWNIGNADSDRYNLYYQLVLQYSKSKRRLLDIGCGFGAFLARFKDDYGQLIGIEISREAILKGKKRFPFITFIEGSAEHLEQVFEKPEKFDTILYSDVISYFNEKGKTRSLEWITDHLDVEGVAFIAAWCPGGDYLTHAELNAWSSGISKSFARPDWIVDIQFSLVKRRGSSSLSPSITRRGNRSPTTRKSIGKRM